MGAAVLGNMPRLWAGGKDKDGWTTYNAQFLVKCESTDDGPDVAFNADGLPRTGDPWVYGNDNRADVLCLPEKQARVYREKEQHPGFYWLVDTTFSDRATYVGSSPLISINGEKYTKEIFRDRFGRLVASSSFELFRGPQVEFDFNRVIVSIRNSQRKVNLPLWSRLANTGALNSKLLWDCPKRTVKFEPYRIEEKREESGARFFDVTFEFSIYVVEDKDGNAVSGWDRDILNEGTKARGEWTWPDEDDINIEDAVWSTDGFGPANDPRSYHRYYDKAGNIARVILNQDGTPWEGENPDDAPTKHIEFHPEADFVKLLGIPNPLWS